jgi:hypothetical protein
VTPIPDRNHELRHPDLPYHDIRYCRTHALVAELFAASAADRSNARTWWFISKAWTELADLKALSKETEARRLATLANQDRPASRIS